MLFIRTVSREQIFGEGGIYNAVFLQVAEFHQNNCWKKISNIKNNINRGEYGPGTPSRYLGKGPWPSVGTHKRLIMIMILTKYLQVGI